MHTIACGLKFRKLWPMYICRKKNIEKMYNCGRFVEIAPTLLLWTSYLRGQSMRTISYNIEYPTTIDFTIPSTFPMEGSATSISLPPKAIACGDCIGDCIRDPCFFCSPRNAWTTEETWISNTISNTISLTYCIIIA